MTARDAWPPLPYAGWSDTAQTLHLWTQVVGKVRLALAVPTNHWWHVPLYVAARGLTTSPIPWDDRSFEIVFDFIAHRLVVACSDGAQTTFPLEPMSVARFHEHLMATLADMGIRPKIWTTPCELADAVPFEQDQRHAAYDPEAAHRFWQVLARTEAVMRRFRSGFVGKASPVHFFWGSFDLAVTFFSGRPAPRHPGSPLAPASVSEEAYSHEVISFGFWPGGGGTDASFYAYAYPEPAALAQAPVRPAPARYDPAVGEFLLPYAAVRESADPDQAVADFYTSVYVAAADLGVWPRATLERPGAYPGVQKRTAVVSASPASFPSARK
jgi:hypothetical protein